MRGGTGHHKLEAGSTRRDLRRFPGVARPVLPVLLGLLWSALAGSVEPSVPAYQPLFRDAPLSRVGSVTRGSSGAQDMMVLAPGRLGASATDQPKLFWYLPAAAGMAVEFVIQERGADRPLLEVQVTPVPERNIGSIALGDFNARLQPGVEYEWSVALVVDPEKRSHDVFSMGSVRYVPPAAALDSRLKSSPVREHVALLLAAGYWYDALSRMQAAIDAGDTGMARWQRELLQSEGLVAGNTPGAGP